MSYLPILSVGAVLLAGLLAWLVWLLLKPMNRVMRLEDVGHARNISKRQIAKALKLRLAEGLPPVYPNGWFVVEESNNLRIGDVKKIEAFGQAMVLFRDRRGVAHLLDAFCPHMGADLSAGGHVVREECIQCPFHGWIFRGSDGKCVEIPYKDNPTKVPENARIHRWRTVEKNAHIYVWYHCDDIEPTWELPDIPEVQSGEWYYGGRSEHLVCCHCEEIPENAADVAHLKAVHSASMFKGTDLSKLPPGCADTHGHYWEASWSALEGEESHIGVMKVVHQMYIWGESVRIPGTYAKVEARQLGPGVVYLHFDFGWLGKGILFHHVTPREPMLQRLQHQIYIGSKLPFGSVISILLGKFTLRTEACMIERDMMVWNNKRWASKPLLVREDHQVAKHRRWYAQFYTANSPRLETVGTAARRNAAAANECNGSMSHANGSVKHPSGVTVNGELGNDW